MELSNSLKEAPYRLDKVAVLEGLGSNEKVGLSSEEARRRLDRFGSNELKETEKTTLWEMFLGQFEDVLVWILLAATVISFILWLYDPGEETYPYDSIIILLIVLANAILGVIQEYRAERSLEALKKLSAPSAVVLRDGQKQRIPAREVVPGDILLLDAGDKVAADARLIEVINLEADESALTGESVPVTKTTHPLEGEVEIGDRKNMIFMGTTITYGRGKAVVVATGMKTEIGAIAEMMQATEKEATPLQKNLDQVGKQLGMVILIICGVVALTGILEHGKYTLQGALQMFLFGVALAVAAIPEGLPAVVTVALAIGVQKMAAKNSIVRKLSAVETLGSTTVICSDKTGTLTRNEMTVRKIWLDGKVIEVTGEGYEPRGEFIYNGLPYRQKDLEHLLRIAALCSNARLVQRADRWEIDGDPTEGALVVAAEKAGLRIETLEAMYPRLGEIPFSSERMRMTTIHRDGERPVAYVKGAPEVILSLCDYIHLDGKIQPLTPELREKILKQNEEMSQQALRTLGFAYRDLSELFKMGSGIESTRVGSGEAEVHQIESRLVFLGLIGMIDPPRKEAILAVEKCRKAGIRPVMITGDHKLTAIAIARELNMISDTSTQVLTGKDLEALDSEKLSEIAEEVVVYARVSPEHKVRIVDALKARNHIAAMTGDGVNDAPALKKADIGVAMGKGGTEVAKEASDMILADDNFATIVAAVEEGRAIFDNIRKFISYLLSSNVGEVVSMFLGVMLAKVLGLLDAEGLAFLPLTATQILWINLVTDGFPALALGVDPKDPRIMSLPPRSSKEQVISRRMWYMIFTLGTWIGLGTLFILDAYYPGGLLEWNPDAEPDHSRTMAFTTMVMFEMFNAFNFRSFNTSVFKVGIFKNRWLLAAISLSIILHFVVLYTPALQRAFHTVPLGWMDWMICIGIGSTVLILGEITKQLGWFRT
jgi:Ca2+-transporting ATPase